MNLNVPSSGNNDVTKYGNIVYTAIFWLNFDCVLGSNDQSFITILAKDILGLVPTCLNIYNYSEIYKELKEKISIAYNRMTVKNCSEVLIKGSEVLGDTIQTVLWVQERGWVSSKHKQLITSINYFVELISAGSSLALSFESFKDSRTLVQRSNGYNDLHKNNTYQCIIYASVTAYAFARFMSKNHLINRSYLRTNIVVNLIARHIVSHLTRFGN